MTEYTSTRDASARVDGATAVLNGFSPDGGLYVPVALPVINYEVLCNLDYAARVEKVLCAFFDFDVSGIAEKAYGDTDDPAPTVKVDDNVFMLELWHGKTCSSKDMALSVLSQLIVRAKAANNITSTTLIPLATAGDMGVAAATAFSELPGTELCIFYPEDRSNGFYRRELLAACGRNISVVGVRAGIDVVQAAVKSAFADKSLNAAIDENNITLSFANSINIGIIVPQIAYFYSAYCDLVNSGEIKAGDKIDFVLPVGNFGGMLAGYYAVKMGLPVNKLVIAGTKFTALTDFIGSGAYDINRVGGTHVAPVLGNLERLVFGIGGNDAALTSSRMRELRENGRFSITESEMNDMRQIFAGDIADSDDAQDALADMFDEYGYLACSRTAAACAVAIRREFIRPTVILSVASPYRTAKDVMTALGEKAGEESEVLFRRMEEQTAMDVPEQLLKVFSAPQIHNTVIEPQDIVRYLTDKYCKH